MSLSLNAADGKSDIEDGPDFQNVSVFLDENPMKEETGSVADRRPSSTGEAQAQLGEQHYSVPDRFMQFFGLAPSPLDIARREKYREMLEEMRATGPLKGNRAIDTAVANPKFLKMLEKYDTNGDGVIDAEEMTVMLNDFKSQKQQSSVLKKVVAGAFLFLIALLICNTFLTLWVIKLTQEVYVDEDTTSMVNSNNEMLKTDKPKFYTSISDLTMLPASALDSITRMTFTTIDGGVYNLLVNGVRMDATAEKSVDIYFTSNKRMHIQGNNTAVFMDYDVSDGPPTEVAVVLNVNDPLSTLSQSRRLSSASVSSSMVSRLGFTGSGSVLRGNTGGSERCFSSGVCLYTYDEMMSLFDEHAAAEGRRLESGSDSSTMTYTEITADAKILTKDDRAGLSRAQGFLSALLQAQADLKNGTLKVSFIMSDLCANYPTLRTDCRSYPAPSVVRPVNVSSLQDRRPFIGTMAEDGLWMFQDEIEYLLDAYSVQVKVRYAHDPLRDTRRHVVLMDLSDPSKMVTYDEVTIQYDPKNPTFVIESAQTFITNYNASSAVKSDGTDTFLDGGVDVVTRRRRLMAHDAFVAHIRSKISGFPSIDVPAEVLTSSVFEGLKKDSMIAMDEVNRRLNAVGSSRNISVDVEESADGYCVTTEMDENGNYLPCLSDVAGLSMQYPKSYFSNVWIGTLSGSIAWPDASSIYSIEQYESTEIVYRSDLKALLDMQTFSNGSSNSTSRRLLSERTTRSSSSSSSLPSGYELAMSFTDDHQRMRIARHVDKNEELHERTKAHFEALDRALGAMLERHERRRRLSEMGVVEGRVGRQLSEATVKGFKSRAVVIHSTVNQFGDLKISDEQKDLIKDKVSSVLSDQIQGYLTDVANTAWNNIPMRKGGTCEQFHTLMVEVLQNIADLNDIIVKTIEYSDNIDMTLDHIETLQQILKDLITVNDLMKPAISSVGQIPYVGPVAKVFQTNFNIIVTNPVNPAKKSVDSLQSKIEAYKVRENNKKFLTTAQNVSTGIDAFIQDAMLFSSVLITVDNVCLWTPTTVNGVQTYDKTVTGQMCSGINVVLREVLQNVNTVKNQMNILLGRIQQLSNFVDIMESFMKTFDAAIIGAVRSVFAVMSSFLDKQISACIPWVCFKDQTVCTTIEYPCGTKKCKTGLGVKVPCGVKFCSEDQCVSVPKPYDCQQCATFTVNQIINGVMSVADQLQNTIMNALNSLAKALGISFPSITIPGLPSIDFMSGIESFLSNMFSDIVDMKIFNAMTKSFNSVKAKLRDISNIVCNK
eukprot:gene15446-17284_t